MLVKSKVEPLLLKLTQIYAGLACYGFLNLVKENNSIFYQIFCPSGLFTWTYKIFKKVVKPNFSENHNNKFIVEHSVYQDFPDMAEAIVMDGKYFIKLFFFLFNIQCKGYYSSFCFSVRT